MQGLVYLGHTFTCASLQKSILRKNKQIY